MDDEKKEELLCALLRMSQIRAEASVIRARRLIADFAPSLKGDDLATIRLAIAIATRPANEAEAKTEPQQGACIPGELLDWLTGPGGREMVMSIDADNEVCIQLLEQEVVDGMRLKAFGLTWQFGLNSAVDLLTVSRDRLQLRAISEDARGASMTTPQTTEEWVQLFNRILDDLEKKQHDTASTENNETLRLLRFGRIAMIVDLLWMIDEENIRKAAKEQA